MKKFAMLLTAVAMLVSNTAHAQTSRSAKNQNTGDNFNWGIALVSLAVFGTMVGLTVSSAASSPNSYSNAN
jgi:hypothetical protein